MKVKFLKQFSLKLADQIEFIALDKPSAARKFKSELLAEIHTIKTMPFRCRKSIYFNDDAIRDLIFKGYVVVYRVKLEPKIIEVFGLVKYEESV